MSDIAQTFDQLVADYYHAWFNFHPEAAVDVGVPGHDTRLAPYDDDAMCALASLHEMLLCGLDELDEQALDAERRLDYQVLRGATVIEHHALLEQDWRHRDPVRFLPVNAIYQLTVRPVVDLAAALSGRLAAIPDYLRGARTYLGEMPELIPPLWLSSALAEAQAGAEFIRTLPQFPQVAQAFPNAARLTGLVDESARALVDFAHYLETEIAPRAAGDFACGRAHFERLLGMQHFLAVDADQLHAFGQRLFDSTLTELKQATRALRGDEDIAALTAQLKADHPTLDELLPTYRAQMLAAKRFVEEHKLVTVPAPQELRVVETPPFMRHRIPFAAYLEPPPNDPAQCGYYYVTPPRDAAELGEHDNPGLMHTCVHEAWPGHHLQFVTANQHPQASSLPRLLNRSATLFEGWALYCEQLMHEQGFLSRPEQRFVLLRDRLWRALRIMLDVELQCRGLGVEQAAQRMQAALGFPHSQALGELAWYTRSPSTPMGYAVGWALILAMRQRVQARDAANFDLRDFHDRLLLPGAIGLPLVLQHAFGPALWREVQAEVFAPAGAG